MKNKWGIVLLCFGIHFGALGQSVDFVRGDLDSIFKANADSDRLYFIDVYTDWCGPCKKLDKESFHDAEISQYMNEEFINIKLNPEEQKVNTWFTIKHKVNSYPTLLFVNSNREVVSEISGYKPKDDLYTILKATNNLWKSKGVLLGELIASNPVDVPAIETFLEDYGAISYSGVIELAERYLTEVSQKDYNAAVIVSLSNVLADIEKSAFRKVMNFEVGFIEGKSNWQYFDRIRLHFDITHRIKDEIDLAIEKEDEATAEEWIAALTPFNETVKEKEIAGIRLKLYEKIDADRYFELAKELIEKYITAYDPQEIKQQEESQYKAMRSEAFKGMMKEFGGERLEESVYKSALDSLSSLYILSRGAADRLDELGDAVLLMHNDDPEKVNMAIGWKRAAIDYFPFDLTRYEKMATIYSSKDEVMSAESLRIEGRKMSLYKVLSEQQGIKLD